METELGLFRAAIIVWVSGLVVSALLGGFVSPLAWSLVAPRGGVDHRWVLAAVVVALHALLGAIGVTFGVDLVGFRISYAPAVFALAFAGVLSLALTSLLVAAQTPTTSTDPTGVALPALGLALWPVSLLVGIVLPAFLVNAAASTATAGSAPPEVPPYPPIPPYSG